MTLRIDTWEFPATAQGLRWSDELAWTAVAQSTDYGLTGALLVQEATKQAGRPLTLLGGSQWAWISRADLLTLQALLESPAQRVLTLHDGRQVPVIPRRDGDGPLSAAPVPIVRDSGPADPQPDTRYAIESLRFLIMGEIT